MIEVVLELELELEIYARTCGCLLPLFITHWYTIGDSLSTCRARPLTSALSLN